MFGFGKKKKKLQIPTFFELSEEEQREVAQLCKQKAQKLGESHQESIGEPYDPSKVNHIVNVYRQLHLDLQLYLAAAVETNDQKSVSMLGAATDYAAMELGERLADIGAEVQPGMLLSPERVSAIYKEKRSAILNSL